MARRVRPGSTPKRGVQERATTSRERLRKKREEIADILLKVSKDEGLKQLFFDLHGLGQGTHVTRGADVVEPWLGLLDKLVEARIIEYSLTPTKQYKFRFTEAAWKNRQSLKKAIGY